MGTTENNVEMQSNQSSNGKNKIEQYGTDGKGGLPWISSK